MPLNKEPRFSSEYQEVRRSVIEYKDLVHQLKAIDFYNNMYKVNVLYLTSSFLNIKNLII